MISNNKRSRSAFTLVEIMIVVAIIGLLAVIAVPGFIRSRQLSQGRALINNCRQIDAAIDQWALENGKTTGDTIDNTNVSVYLKDGKLKTAVASSKNISDVLDQISIRIAATLGASNVSVDSAVKTKLGAVTDWGSY